MSIAEAFLAEFETQAAATRRFLERLPQDKLTWKPHPKSLSAGQLALHIAAVPAGVLRRACDNPASFPDIVFPQPMSCEEILATFDETIATVRNQLPKFNDAAMHETWCMVAGASRSSPRPRLEYLRDVMFSHWYQHRGQFSVYLRLLDIPVPATWGPSADEPPPSSRPVKPA